MKQFRILVCLPQVPFVYGGAEALVEQLVINFRTEGYIADTASVPFQDYPHEALLRSASTWRWLDFDGFTPFSADLLVATKFPSYFARHPKKIVWLFHNYRQVYDLYQTEFSGYSDERPDNLQLMRWVAANDKQSLSECKKILTISKNVSSRLQHFLGLDSEVLYPPPQLESRFHCADYEPFIFVAQRLDPNKRTELLLESLEHWDGEYQVWIAGTGPDEGKLRAMVSGKRLENRVRFLGRISNDKLVECYARCRCVYYAPYDEDYGFCPVEAFLSHKPVVTTEDSGGVLEFVDHLETGWIAKPNPTDIATGIRMVFEDLAIAQTMGDKGYNKVKDLTWKKTMSKFHQIIGDLT